MSSRNYEQLKAEGWLNGPTYARAEIVFDDDDQDAIEENISF